MKIEFHPDILDWQHYTCNCCGRGCRSFLVPVRPEEREAISAQRDWRTFLHVKDLFVKHRAAGPAGFGLAKWPDGRCIFLDADNLCLIHKYYGLQAKPLACQLFPFVFTPFAGSLRVGLRFDCPGVCTSDGRNLSDYIKEVQSLANRIVPAGVENMPLPAVTGRQKIEASWFEFINEILLQIVTSDALDLVRRLHWLYCFAKLLTHIKWEQVSEDVFEELVNLFKGGTLAELQQPPPSRVVKPKARKLLGQFFFLLTQPSTIITSQKEPLGVKLKKRMAQARALHQLAQTTGPLPKIQPDWPNEDMAALEHSFGPWPGKVQEVISRWLACRIAGMNYCGPNCYQYSLTEGVYSLLVAVITMGWVMRIEALKAHRRHLELADTHNAIMTIDGNLGYSQALAFGPARLRLNVIGEYLSPLIETYCR